MVRYHASGMRLQIDSDDSYLSVRKSRRRVGGHYYLSKKANRTKPPTKPTPNEVLHALYITLRNVMASAVEDELGALFYNGQVDGPICTCLEEMGYPQPSTPIKTDNSTAAGIVNSSIRHKKSKAMDIRFYWVKYRVSQKYLLVYWESGLSNKGDCYTKHFPTSHHVHVHLQYVHR